MIGPEWLPRLAGVIVLPPSGPLISKIPDFPALPSSFQKPQDTTQTIRLPTELPPLDNSVSMQPDLQAQIDQALFDYDNMASAPQLEKLHQILMMYTQGDEHAVEGIKLTYICLVSRHASGTNVGSSSANDALNSRPHKLRSGNSTYYNRHCTGCRLRKSETSSKRSTTP